MKPPSRVSSSQAVASSEEKTSYGAPPSTTEPSPIPSAAAGPSPETPTKHHPPELSSSPAVVPAIFVPAPAQEDVDGLTPDARIEIENLRAEVKDVTEKLEVMKAKRTEDRVKLKEAESMRVQLAQLEENRKLMQEKSADLQRQLAHAKNGSSFFLK